MWFIVLSTRLDNSKCLAMVQDRKKKPTKNLANHIQRRIQNHLEHSWNCIHRLQIDYHTLCMYLHMFALDLHMFLLNLLKSENRLCCHCTLG